MRRVAIYIVGMLLLAAGIILNTKTAMGVSPLVCLAFCVSELRGLSFSNLTLVLYLIYFVIEVALQGRKTRPADLLQIPFCFVFTRCMNFIAILLPDPVRLPIRIVMLAAGIFCTGFGAAIMLNTRLIPNPADGLVKILGVRIHRKTGLAKNIMDAVSVTITIIIGVLAARRLVGVGVGTVCAVLGTGRVMALCNRLFAKPIGETVRRSPIRIFDGPVEREGTETPEETKIQEEAETPEGQKAREGAD